ncbi:hypothetical protein BCV69DRAFT_320 [Microstroma glucosiphilum]|uniref:Uncharacterized protein n=1 Tax=Pseudomicrostroma glucosiphilum TaxID=1684307 RepID=A0A316UDX8_9BASI|nr:hypothetical protein BCV69DRAFT_320 [Pseudomicrostroma glucosiphilum]PWN23467.1 hypothetical protein BCV69DRAFT_320 [Pseudomicrostroma glucosiphilum]
MKLLRSLSFFVLLVSTALTVAGQPQAEASMAGLRRQRADTALPRTLSPFNQPQAQLVEPSLASSLQGRSLSLPAEGAILPRSNRFLQGLKSKLKKCVTCGSSSRGGGRRRGAAEQRPAKHAVHPRFSPVHVPNQAGDQGQAPPLPVVPLHRQNRNDMDAFLNAVGVTRTNSVLDAI